MQISIDEVAQEYAKDAAQRKVVVLQTFRKDAVTDRFIDSFPSKLFNMDMLVKNFCKHKNVFL